MKSKKSPAQRRIDRLTREVQRANKRVQYTYQRWKRAVQKRDRVLADLARETGQPNAL